MDVVSDLELRIEHSGGIVQVEKLPMIEGDPLQLRQLFQNLIVNALKFHKEQIPPRVKVTGSSLENAIAEIIVEDNGIGFSEQFSERIFQPFQRLHAQGAYEGSGIGLAICQKIVERHSGTIKAFSQVGQGASFIVHLPLKQ